MKIVLEANGLVAGLLSPFGPSGRVLDLLLVGELHLAYDDRIAAEYREVLARPRFSFDARAVADVLAYLLAEGEAVVARPLAAVLPDPDDAPFLEVATQTGSPLVTSNLRHYREGACGAVRVCSPDELLALLAYP